MKLKHTSKSTVDYIKRVTEGFVMVSQCPDLKIIENVWIDLERAACNRQPEISKNWKTFGRKNGQRYLKQELKGSWLATKSVYKL